MIKGTTKSGFDYTVQEEALDDYELLEELREIDKGNTSLVVDAIEKIIRLRTKGTIKRTCERRSGKSVDKTNV